MREFLQSLAMTLCFLLEWMNPRRIKESKTRNLNLFGNQHNKQKYSLMCFKITMLDQIYYKCIEQVLKKVIKNLINISKSEKIIILMMKIC